MKKIISFGDSFIFGSELAHNHDGHKAWPGIVAKDLGLEYQTRAIPGCGNDAIARQVLSYFHTHSADNTLAVINWTWSMRWDFYITQSETWITLGPTCVPQKLENLITETQAQRVVDFYRDYANSSLLWNKIRNLQTMFAVQQYLKLRGIGVVQTSMDQDLLDRTWHAPDYVRELQTLVESDLMTWNGMNFLDWSRQQGFAVTEPGWHPLEQAHEAAADFWRDHYSNMLALV